MAIIVQQVGDGWARATGVQEVNGARLDMAKVARLVDDGVWTDKDLTAYGLKVAVPFAVPEGERLAGLAVYTERDGVVVESYATETIGPQPYRLFKSTFVQRMTDLEAGALEAVLQGANAKLRLIYHSVEYFVSDDVLFAVLYHEVLTALGAARADELLGAE